MELASNRGPSTRPRSTGKPTRQWNFGRAKMAASQSNAPEPAEAKFPSSGRLANKSGQPHVFDEALFRGVLLRERRRADRSRLPVALLLLEIDPSGASVSSTWSAAIEALRAATRQTDVLGWVEVNQVIGILLTDITAPSAGFARVVDTRVRRELAQRLDAQTVGRLSIRLQIDPGPNRDGSWPAEIKRLQLDRAETRATSYDAIKRGLDVVGSLTLMAALSPVLVVIAGLVKLRSPGPVFYKQERVGRMMKTFTMLKFRTMDVNADHSIHHQFVSSFIKSQSQLGESGNNGLFKITNDPRVTRLGRVLRSTSLDELPQLWNVLWGDMSLVGPRPPLPYQLEQYQAWHQRRVLEAKPGMTGLWQVEGRSRTTFDDMVRLDLQYARRRSLWVDLKILLQTPGAVISGKGAC